MMIAHNDWGWILQARLQKRFYGFRIRYRMYRTCKKGRLMSFIRAL